MFTGLESLSNSTSASIGFSVVEGLASRNNDPKEVGSMEFGVFIPIANGGRMMSVDSPK